LDGLGAGGERAVQDRHGWLLVRHGTVHKNPISINVFAESSEVASQHFGIGGTKQLDAEDAGLLLR
jgi:hypothetical protein